MKRDFDNKKKGFWGIESLGFCRVVVIVVRGGGCYFGGWGVRVRVIGLEACHYILSGYQMI